MILIICMAGFNTRFHDAGFDIPKYLLPWGESTVIREILTQLTSDGAFKEIILLANRRDRYFADSLESSVAEFEPSIHYIGDTLGQAHTAYIGAALSLSGGPILIHNADTIVTHRDIKKIGGLLVKHDAFIDVFSGDNPAFCFVDCQDGKAIGIAEKKRLTKHASSGLYGFKSAADYAEWYTKALDAHRGGEVFVSDVLAQIISHKKSIAVNQLNTREETIVIGSPQEYSVALSGRT